MLAAESSGGQVKLSHMDPLERIVRLRARTVLAVLGIILAVFSVIDRTWPAVGVGLAGTALALVVRHRSCRDLADQG